MSLKIDQAIDPAVLQQLPVTFYYLKPLPREGHVFIDKFVAVKKYQSERCRVLPPSRPISKIL